jgi:hypothetical protein
MHPFGYVLIRFVNHVLNMSGILESSWRMAVGVISESAFCTRKAVAKKMDEVPSKSGNHEHPFKHASKSVH